jgi:hypothetical protein
LVYVPRLNDYKNIKSFLNQFDISFNLLFRYHKDILDKAVLTYNAERNSFEKTQNYFFSVFFFKKYRFFNPLFLLGDFYITFGYK